LGNLLVRNLGCKILVTGTPAEEPLVTSICARIGGAFAVTDLPLLTMAALIRRLDMLIANDTGPMHLGIALKTPTIGLFAPTDPQLCGPYGTNSAIAITKKPTCTPCLRKRCKEPFCLLQIGVQEVYDKAFKSVARSYASTNCLIMSALRK
jgi:ADP-heptose:LPS heptosyltransferase